MRGGFGNMGDWNKNEFEGFIIDLDGTVYLGSQAIEGAKEALERIRAAGKKVVF